MLDRPAMAKDTLALLLASTALLGAAWPRVAQAQPAPSGAHPRIWLDAATHAGLQQQARAANSPVRRAAARCDAAYSDPSDYAEGGWQGFEYVTTLSACLTAYTASGRAEDLATAIKY